MYSRGCCDAFYASAFSCSFFFFFLIHYSRTGLTYGEALFFGSRRHGFVFSVGVAPEVMAGMSDSELEL